MNTSVNSRDNWKRVDELNYIDTPEEWPTNKNLTAMKDTSVKEEVKHTALPWTTTSMTMLGDMSGKRYEIGIMPKSRYHQQHVAKCWDAKEVGRNGGLKEDEADANAKFIVKACNSHYSLLEENKQLREVLKAVLPYLKATGTNGNHWVPMVEQAISKAEQQ